MTKATTQNMPYSFTHGHIFTSFIVEVKHPWPLTWKITCNALSTWGSVTLLQSSSLGTVEVKAYPQAASNISRPMESPAHQILKINFCKQNLPNMITSINFLSPRNLFMCFVLIPSSVFSYPPRRKHSLSTNTLPACMWPITFKFILYKLKTAWK